MRVQTGNDESETTTEECYRCGTIAESECSCCGEWFCNKCVDYQWGGHPICGECASRIEMNLGI